MEVGIKGGNCVHLRLTGRLHKCEFSSSSHFRSEVGWGCRLFPRDCWGQTHGAVSKVLLRGGVPMDREDRKCVLGACLPGDRGVGR